MTSEVLNFYWSEKYRPKTVDDMILSTKDKNLMKKFIESEEIVNLLFVGSPGTGKSTLARILTMTLTHSDDDRMIINASDERGINVVREKIIPFMSIPPYKSKIKIVMLDEVDYFTDEAFAALRSAVEDPVVNSHLNTRFVLTANDIFKIPAAIKSRMQVITYDKPSKKDIYERCSQILDFENVTFRKEILEKLIEKYYPDMRNILGLLSMSIINNQLVETHTPIPFENIKEIIRNLVKSNSFDDCMKFRGELIDSLGVECSANEILKWMLDEFVNDPLIHSLTFKYLTKDKIPIDEKHLVIALMSDIILSWFSV